jgi:hypothetical protein
VVGWHVVPGNVRGRAGPGHRDCPGSPTLRSGDLAHQGLVPADPYPFDCVVNSETHSRRCLTGCSGRSAVRATAEPERWADPSDNGAQIPDMLA